MTYSEHELKVLNKKFNGDTEAYEKWKHDRAVSGGKATKGIAKNYTISEERRREMSRAMKEAWQIRKEMQK